MPRKKKEETIQKTTKSKHIASVEISRTTKGLKVNLNRSKLLMDWFARKAKLSKTKEGFNRELRLEYYALPDKSIMGGIRNEVIINGHINPAILRVKDDTFTIPNVAIRTAELEPMLKNLTNTIKDVFVSHIKPITASAEIYIQDNYEEENEPVEEVTEE